MSDFTSVLKTHLDRPRRIALRPIAKLIGAAGALPPSPRSPEQQVPPQARVLGRCSREGESG
jgi:hypothetical protein